VNHNEYVQVPGEALVARDGAYEVRVTEELREVSYLDRIRLVAVDHPADAEIFTNEKFISPPFPGVPAIRCTEADPAGFRGPRPRSGRTLQESPNFTM